MDNISIEVIAVLVIMLVSAIRWFLENVVGKNQDRDHEDQSGPVSTLEDLYEEARREILDRQGRMYPEADEREEAEAYWEERKVAPPPVPTVTPPPLPTQPTPAASPLEQFQKAEKPKLSAAEKAALERMKKREAASSRKRRRPHAQTDVRSLLESPGAARKAIALREILGPPKAARELQDHLA